MRLQKSSRPLLKDLINSIVSVSITEYRNAIMQNHRGQNSLNTLLTVLLYMNVVLVSYTYESYAILL